MSVDLAPAPEHIAPPADADDRVHTGLFWLAIVAVVIGAMTAGVSRVWAAKSSSLVTFPPAFDQTVAMQGGVTFHVDPHTLVPLQSPTVSKLTLTRHTSTPGQLGFRSILVTTDALAVGTEKTTLLSQDVIDIRTMRNLATPTAWSFTGSNVADRSSAYSVNLPFDTGAGPYAIWLDQADRAYTFTQVGRPFVRDDLTVIRLRGHLDATPVDPAYITEMSRAGLPAAFTLSALRPAIAALGVDVPTPFPPMPGDLSTSDVATMLDPVPLDYSMTADTDLLVEPRTGTIVATEKTDQAFTAHLDATRLRAAAAVMDSHRSAPGMAAALAGVARLTALADAPAFDLSYAQTAASVQHMSSWAAAQRDWANRMTRVIPATLLAVGLAVAGLGILAAVVAWRRRDTVYEY